MGDLWDGETTDSRSKRRVPRFRVTPSLPISVSIRQLKDKTFSAVTLSPLGLGFFGTPNDAEMLKLCDVDIKIKMDKFLIDLKARVKYCSVVRRQDGTFNYFGVQFLSVKPMLNILLEKFISDRLKIGHLVLS